jgi:hypothetical protein
MQGKQCPGSSQLPASFHGIEESTHLHSRFRPEKSRLARLTSLENAIFQRFCDWILNVRRRAGVALSVLALHATAFSLVPSFHPVSLARYSRSAVSRSNVATRTVQPPGRRQAHSVANGGALTLRSMAGEESI